MPTGNKTSMELMSRLANTVTQRNVLPYVDATQIGGVLPVVSSSWFLLQRHPGGNAKAWEHAHI